MTRESDISVDVGKPAVENISAVTLSVSDMNTSVRFYTSLGFDVVKGGEKAAFTTLGAGEQALNLTTEGEALSRCWWGRVIFHVADVDAMYRCAVAAGAKPEFAPRDAAWGERYFHLIDPDGHEISFARPMA